MVQVISGKRSQRLPTPTKKLANLYEGIENAIQYTTAHYTLITGAFSEKIGF